MGGTRVREHGSHKRHNRQAAQQLQACTWSVHATCTTNLLGCHNLTEHATPTNPICTSTFRQPMGHQLIRFSPCIYLGQEVGVLLQRALGEHGLAPEVGGQEAVGGGQGVEGGLHKVALLAWEGEGGKSGMSGEQ